MKKLLVFITLCLCASLLIVACDKKENDDEPIPTAARTSESTQKPEPTQEISPTPSTTLKPLTSDEKGKPHKDAEVVLKEDFEDGEISEDEFSISQGEHIVIENGQMNIPQDWSAVSPIYEYALGTKHNQYEFSFDMSSEEKGANPYAYFIGARVPKEIIATYPGGLWVAFTENKVVHVLPGGDNFVDKNGNIIETWHDKKFEIQLPEGFDTMKKITVIDTGDTISYYLTKENGDLYLIVKAVLDGADLICYGNDGSVAWSGENVLNEDIGFSLFSHFTKTHTDNIILKAY